MDHETFRIIIYYINGSVIDLSLPGSDLCGLRCENVHRVVFIDRSRQAIILSYSINRVIPQIHNRLWGLSLAMTHLIFVVLS